ncbi:MAG: peptidylprolyl isomerase [Hyphomicrobium sp.]
MKIRLAQAVLTLALASAALPAVSSAAFAEDKVVATVNGIPVTEADLAIADSEIGADMGTLPPAQKRMSLLEFLIDNQLFAEAADAEKLGEGPDFETRLKYLKRRALRELYFEKVIKSSVSDADARKIYDDQVKLIKPEEEVSARHILVDSEEKAKEIKEKLKAGGDFVALAKEYTLDTGTKEDGGNLGYFGRGQMVPQFEEVVFKLNKGEVSDPVKTQFGWHLIKIEDKRFKQPPAFDIVKDRIIQSQLLQKAQQSAVALRAKSKIEFVDPEIKTAIEERNKQIEAIPAAAKPADAAPADAKPDEAKPADAKPEDAKPEEKK